MEDKTRLFQQPKDKFHFGTADAYAIKRYLSPAANPRKSFHAGPLGHKSQFSQQTDGYIIITTTVNIGTEHKVSILATAPKIAIKVQPQYSPQVCSFIKRNSDVKILSDQWQDDRSYVVVIEVKPEKKDGFLKEITSLTRGSLQSRELPANWSLYNQNG